MPIPPTSIPTEKPPTPIVPTPTPTEIPRNPFLVKNLDFSKEGPVILEFSFGKNTYLVDFNLLPFTDFTPNERVNHLINQRFRAGNNSGMSVDGKYLNTILYLHSGYINSSPLEAEPIRVFIEGYRDETILDETYNMQRLESLEGKKISIAQGFNLGDFAVHAATKIPHEHMPSFTNIKEAVDVASSFGTRNKEGFSYFKNEPGVILTFCGWGPENASKNPNSFDYRYTYAQYVLGLKPE